MKYILQALEKTWENIGATMGTLDSTSTNIIQLIEDSYNVRLL